MISLRILTVILLAFFIIGCATTEVKEDIKPIIEKPKQISGGEIMAKNIVMVVAPDGYRDEELDEPKAVLEKAGANVKIASKGVSVAKGKLGGSIDVDMDISAINVADYDAVVFIGGPGSSVYFDDATAQAIAKQAVEQGKVLGAICIAPSTLANAGVLEGKKATAFSSEAGNLEAKGASYTGEAVTIDGNIITADGPSSAKKFGEAILQKLS